MAYEPYELIVLEGRPQERIISRPPEGYKFPDFSTTLRDRLDEIKCVPNAKVRESSKSS